MTEIILWIVLWITLSEFRIGYTLPSGAFPDSHGRGGFCPLVLAPVHTDRVGEMKKSPIKDSISALLFDIVTPGIYYCPRNWDST